MVDIMAPNLGIQLIIVRNLHIVLGIKGNHFRHLNLPITFFFENVTTVFHL